MKTFPIWEPEQSSVSKNIVSLFKKHQTELQKQLSDANDLFNNKIVISSPANKNVVYSLELAFEIILNHEKHHLEQAKEILKEIKN